MDFPIKHGVLQGNLDAAGFQILNLNLAGLNLTKNSVGLGNVDNTSDVNKPVSTAQAAAIALREPAITLGTSQQFWKGDKTWQTFGLLALVDGNTGYPLLASRAASNTLSGKLEAQRDDSAASTWLEHFGASSAGSILGISAANAGLLEFHASAYGFIKTNNTAPLVFGYNNIRRMRLMTGLTVGTDVDPGAGCISAAAAISSATLAISGAATFGANITVVGSAALQGAVTTTLGVNVGQNLAVGGNAAVSGFLAVVGNVDLTGLPTADPHVAGRVWRSTNDLKISTG